MMTTITPADMKALETRFMAENNVPGALLMEHAALGVADAIARYADKGTAVFLCGPGNNGGDGYAAARIWKARGGNSHIIEVTNELRGDALLNRQKVLEAGIPCEIARNDAYYDLPPCDVVVDALFGTGLARPVDGAAAHLIHCANDRYDFQHVPIIAVDIPSGIDGTTGKALGTEVIRATETVTFHRVKHGLLLGDAPDYVGKLIVHPITIPLNDNLDDEYGGLTVLEPADLDSGLFTRPQICHKGDFGRVLLFCGSRGMAGAAALCANAAMRAGAGLTTILCRESLLPILQTLAPGAMCTVLPEKNGQLLPEASRIAYSALQRADAACIGCGLGQTDDLLPILRLFAEADCPVVWDADALNLLAKHDDLFPLKDTDVITPHPGEAARLLGCDTGEITADALSALHRLHEKCGCTVLLKGARSLITDGETTCCNLYTSPALAKGGSGDVLAGVITALLARSNLSQTPSKLLSVDATAFGALIHGLAGIRAAKKHGENCTLPTDIVDSIRLDGSPAGDAEGIS